MTDYKTLIAELRAVEPTWHRGMYGCPRDMYTDVKPLLDQAANALEAATTPRVVTTAEELHALPVQSVVMGQDGETARRVDRDIYDGYDWLFVGSDEYRESLEVGEILPATVLFTPEATR